MVTKKEKRKPVLCPLISIAKQSLQPCLEEKCALYFLKDHECVLISLVLAIDFLGDQIQSAIMKRAYGGYP